mgnify:CR=1 FL=1
MFESTDFELPLEKQLRLRVINKEVDECRDTDEIKEQLKQCAEVLMKYQHLLSLTLKRNMERDMAEFIGIIEEGMKGIIQDGS